MNEVVWEPGIKLSNQKIISIYLNLSVESLVTEFRSFFRNIFISDKFKYLKIIQLIKNLNLIHRSDVLLIVNAFDEDENPKKVFEMINEAKKFNKDFYIFFPSEEYTTSANKMNLNKMSSILETKNKLIRLYPEKIIYYKDLDDLSQQFYEKIFVKAPKITISTLTLENISHFNNLEINFNDKNTCLIGMNGTGKTTILRAIAFTLIGNNHKALKENSIKNLLKISGLTNHLINRKIGKISLTYKMDSNTYRNSIVFNPTDDGDIEINYEKDTDFEVLNGDFIKSLIIGFTQNRGILKISENDLKQRNEVQLPHVTDLIPLINNEGDNRLKAFSTWIINLDAKANKVENEALKNKQENIYIKEREIIKKVFQILSEITEEEISFKEVLNNNDVWINTKNNPHGISLELVSQGFQSVIGWIGYFLQRMAESYSDSKDFTKEPAICFVDEIDIYIHPKWQRNILEVLERHFENTQFIITTHSPLVISNLKNDNTNVYSIQKDSVEKIFAYGKDMNSILYEAYGVTERPNEAQNILDSLYRLLEDEKIDEAKKQLEKIKTLITGNDPDIVKAETMLSMLEE